MMFEELFQQTWKLYFIIELHIMLSLAFKKCIKGYGLLGSYLRNLNQHFYTVDLYLLTKWHKMGK